VLWNGWVYISVPLLCWHVQGHVVLVICHLSNSHTYDV
jgi:hypothetical protein